MCVFSISSVCKDIIFYFMVGINFEIEVFVFKILIGIVVGWS